MAYKNHWEEKGLRRVFTGNISGEEVFGANLEIHGDARFDSINYVVNDFTQVVEFEISEIDIHKIVAIDNVAVMSNPYLKIAIVATLEPLLVWIQMYAENMRDSRYESAIFDNIYDAYSWAS